MAEVTVQLRNRENKIDANHVTVITIHGHFLISLCIEDDGKKPASGKSKAKLIIGV